MEVYDALNLDDRSDWRAWNTNVETFLGIHYETQSSSFTLVEDVYKRLKITETDMPRMMLLKRVQAALGNPVELFGQDYFVNMKSKQYPEITTTELSKHSTTSRQELEARKTLSNSAAAQVNMNVTYEEACALSYFREGEIMKGLREVSGVSYMPVIVNEVRAMIASEAIMYATDNSIMLRKQAHDTNNYVELNLLYNEMSEKMPSLVKIMDFIKHAVPTGKRQKDTYSQEKREAIIASILAKAMCSFDSKLDTYKVQLSSLLLNNGTSGEFELDLLAETNDTYPYKQKKRFLPRSSAGTGPKSDIVLYKGKDGKSKMVNLYDLVKYDPATGSGEEAEGEAAAGETDLLPLGMDSEADQKPFLVVSKVPNRPRKRRRGGYAGRPYRAAPKVQVLDVAGSAVADTDTDSHLAAVNEDVGVSLVNEEVESGEVEAHDLSEQILSEQMLSEQAISEVMAAAGGEGQVIHIAVETEDGVETGLEVITEEPI